MTDIDVLRGAKIFQGLSDEQLETLVDASTIATYRQHQVVFEERSRGRELYIILDGQVAVAVDPARLGTVDQGSVDLRIIHTLAPGDSFGEVGLISGQPRNATIVANQDNTRLLIVSQQIFDHEIQAQVILGNIALELARKLQLSNTRVIEDTLATYYINVLVEELAAGAYECSPTIPCQHITVIRNPESFILCGAGRLLPDTPVKETIEIAFFAEAQTLQALVGPGTPTGAVIFSALFSILRTGAISERVADAGMVFQLDPRAERRRGVLTVDRLIEGQQRAFTIEWQLKGARYTTTSRTASAYLFLHIWTDEAMATRNQAQQVIADIAMPVQRSMLGTLRDRGLAVAGMRVLVIHHRSHEVARTLQTIQELGYQIDSFIGIPYGDISWDYITMLDHASGQNYMSLRQITHPTEPTRYAFDFRQSSFLDSQAERDIDALYEDPAIAGDYLAAMQALAEYRLVRALQICRERGERLMIYEDGAYIVARIYELYHDPGHPLHTLIRSAIDDGVIVGAIEVTVAGERRNLQVIKEHGGCALLPVLSNARSDIKSVYEAMGVGEAVIHASATAFGRLGLPTFQARRIAVVGGNGAIGTRLVEQLAMIHNSTANVFAVDVAPHAFSLPIDRATVPYAATRLAYRPLPRYLVSDSCLPILLDHPWSARTFQPDRAVIAQAIQSFLAKPSRYHELALTNSYPLAPGELAQLWREVAQQSGYVLVEVEELPDERGGRYHLRRDELSAIVTLLSAATVLAFADSARPIHSGVTTVVGCTGYPSFNARHLDAFFARPSPTGHVDSLALISASSKDYEFRPAIDLLNRLLQLQSAASLPADLRLAWFTELYRDEISFVRGEDFAALQRLMMSPLDRQAFERWAQTEPTLAAKVGLDGGDEGAQRGRVADFIHRNIRRRVSIHKEIRPDVGSIYHLSVDGQAKQVVLLADGFVVNFFARHEKGVKTEFIDPIVTMQVLGLVTLTTHAPAPGLYKLDAYLRGEDLAVLWSAIDESCRPLNLRDS